MDMEENVVSALIGNQSVKQQKDLNVIILQFGRQLIIGREMSCDLRIDSLEISRKHAVITSEDNNWFITDLESTNGLYINGKQLISFTPYCLKSGDKISFGPKDRSQLIYKFVDDYCPDRYPPKGLKRKPKYIDNQMLSKKVCNEWNQLLDSELSCSICHEVFVSAVNLNCGHTFCKSCIDQWKDANADNDEDSVVRTETHCCPVCRQPMVSQNRVLVLDNVIDYLINKWSPKLSEQRKQLIDERKQLN